MKLSGDRTLKDWTPAGKVPSGFAVDGVVLGSSAAGAGLEIVILVAETSASTSREALGQYHAARVGKRNAPVVIAAIRDGSTWLFGPSAGGAVVGPLPTQQAERMLQAALDEPSALSARQRLAELYRAVADAEPDADGNALPGVANSGLFATHELRHGVRRRDDWDPSCEAAQPLLPKRKQELIEALGFTPHREAAHALVLADGATSRAVAVLLDEAEHFDSQSNRFHVSPVAYALSLAQQHELPWVLILRGSQLRLYPAKAELGVGRKGLAETYFELDLALVSDETAGFLPLIFSARALAPDGSAYGILTASSQYAVALGERLRGQVYDQIVPRLSLAVADQLRELGYELDREGLDRAYQLTLRIFFRLLFQAYAEDRKLLPYGENPRYDRNALNTYARDIVENPDQPFDENSSSIWDDLKQVWHVIDKGDSAWSVPAYNGGLFSADPELHPEGAILERMSVTNDVMGPVLRAMLLDEAEGAIGPIDFRSLSVREFGTIYEGLLESNLAIAEVDLIRDDDDAWIPASRAARPADPARTATKGTVYFHNSSGQRKGTGSYFTPSFVVEHILEHSLAPALEQHLSQVSEKLESGDQAGAADQFFDFRVADIAMGSGHFLTAAIDHLEAGMASFLEEHPIPGVTNELARLEAAARTAAGPDVPEPERSSLLRRQIARRCIYGLDVNPVAVELARVSIWIHTFVRGLPMSSLDHNLVCANSLTGVPSIDAAIDALVPGRDGVPTLFDAAIQEALTGARDLLIDAALSLELDRTEAQEVARVVQAAAIQADEPRLLFDAALLATMQSEAAPQATTPQEIAEEMRGGAGRALVDALKPAHMPALFPEVFLRPTPGFDVLIGNPPWDKLRHEATQFWAQKAPGLLSETDRDSAIQDLRAAHPDYAAEETQEIEARERLRLALQGMFHAQGTGHADLSKLFTERNATLAASHGTLGLVLPGAFASLSGWAPLRTIVLGRGASYLVQAENARGFLFPRVDSRVTVVLVVSHGGGPTNLIVRPGVRCQADLEHPLSDRSDVDLSRSVVIAEGQQVPWLGSVASAAVLAQIASVPTLSSGASWVCGEPDTRWDFSGSGRHKAFASSALEEGCWRVLMTRHVGHYALLPAETRRFVNSVALAELGASGALVADAYGDWVLAPDHPEIVYRFPSSATNSRTLIAARLPRKGAFYSTGYAHGIKLSDASRDDVTALLAILNSIPTDWWARRLVDRHVGARIIRQLPVPALDSQERGRLAELGTSLEALAAADALDPMSAMQTLAEVDAIVARGYGLTADQVSHMFATFHRGWDYQPRLEETLHQLAAKGVPR